MVSVKLKDFLKSQPVLAAAATAAVLSMFFVPPDRGYAGYINSAVLIQLFALMLSISGLRSVGIFRKLTGFMLKKAGNLRRLCAIFVLLCFFTSMIVTNDVALLTFVPLTILVFEKIEDEKSRILTVVLETVGANMGSMLTPIGNPQNLYIYDEFGLSAEIFIKTTLPMGALSLAMLLAFTLLIPKTGCVYTEAEEVKIDRAKTAWYAALFGVCLLSVFHVISELICLIAAIAVCLLTDRKILLKADYGLLATFVCFFVFVGNIGRIDAVRELLSEVLEGREVIVSALLSQAISNVPAAVMLSGFTENGTALLLGVNLGGLGTLIASLASLISYQLYRKSDGAQSGKYMLYFSVINFSMLAILLGVNFLI